MAHPNEDTARSVTEALSKRDMDAFFSHQTDDVILHFPGRSPLAGDYRGRDGIGQLFQRQMQMLDSMPDIENHDVLANDEHAVILNTVRASRGGRTHEQRQVVVMHFRDGKVAETWLQFSDQQGMDEMASS